MGRKLLKTLLSYLIQVLIFLLMKGSSSSCGGSNGIAPTPANSILDKNKKTNVYLQSFLKVYFVLWLIVAVIAFEFFTIRHWCKFELKAYKGKSKINFTSSRDWTWDLCLTDWAYLASFATLRLFSSLYSHAVMFYCFQLNHLSSKVIWCTIKSEFFLS